MDYAKKYLAGYRPRSDFKTADGLWRCSCGTVGKWGDGWSYKGSVMGDDYGLLLAVHCPACTAELPRNAVWLREYKV